MSANISRVYSGGVLRGSMVSLFGSFGLFEGGFGGCWCWLSHLVVVWYVGMVSLGGGLLQINVDGK